MEVLLSPFSPLSNNSRFGGGGVLEMVEHIQAYLFSGPFNTVSGFGREGLEGAVGYSVGSATTTGKIALARVGLGEVGQHDLGVALGALGAGLEHGQVVGDAAGVEVLACLHVVKGRQHNWKSVDFVSTRSPAKEGVSKRGTLCLR